jgi:hypothetical protein
MPLYSLEFTRTRYFRLEVEAESLADARARAKSMPASEILGAHDYDAEVELDEVYAIDEDGNRISEPDEPAPAGRIGADEIAAALNEIYAVPEACQ